MERPDHCLNCGQALDGNFCSQCGQKGTDLNVPFRHLLGDLLSEVIAFDSRLLRTLVPFLTRPGQLTVEYNAGRRVHYVPPIRFYVFISFVVFLTAAFTDLSMVRVHDSSEDSSRVITGFEVTTSDESDESDASDPVQPSVPEEEDPGADPPAAAETSDPPLSASYWEKFGRTIEQNPKLLNERFTARFAQVLFFYVPIFALLLKLFYRRHDVLFIGHLTFSAYYHAFVFFVIWMFVLIAVFGVSSATRDNLQGVVGLITAVYLFLSLRRVYGESRVRTLFKMVSMFFIYMVLLSVGMAVTLFVSEWTI